MEITIAHAEPLHINVRIAVVFGAHEQFAQMAIKKMIKMLSMYVQDAEVVTLQSTKINS